MNQTPPSNFRYMRSDWKLPPVALRHVDLLLRFFDDRVEGEETLHFEARETLDDVTLDARDLEIGPAFARIGGESDAADGEDEAEFEPCATLQDRCGCRLAVCLPRRVAAGQRFSLRVSATSRPSGNILEGIYRDTTPPGAPQQYVSQCQQWGFQRIMPIIDDCTAKCTWRTELQGDARYTHLISNGDVDRALCPDGRPVPVPGDLSRVRIAYVNPVPMPPYLFIAAAGTWDSLASETRTPGGRTVRLEYLVPPGRRDGARLPMEILRDSVAFQARAAAYEYPRECYRTICMEKSNFGGMENVGNTTIVTEAALLDKWTPDRRLFYAFGVIVHEYEHNHCGSDVTMETPFDMWLNEAYTVQLEQDFLADRFGAAFARLDALDGIRDPLRGPLAQEDGAAACFPIVRDGFDSPDDVVDGVTYDKAPEVLGMLREWLGRENYDATMRAYFARHAGGNVDTDDLIDAFVKHPSFPDRGRDIPPPALLDRFFREWLFTTGYPRVEASWRHDAAARRLVVTLRQSRGGSSRNPFVVPFRIRGVAASGAAIPGIDRLLVLSGWSEDFVFDGVDEPPAFLDLNSGLPFYGTARDVCATPASLSFAARKSPFPVGRVEAFRELCDRAVSEAIESGAHDVPDSPATEALFSAMDAALREEDADPGVRARLLSIPEDTLRRDLLPLGRERAAAARALRRAAARRLGAAALLRAYRAEVAAGAAAPAATASAEDVAKALPRRMLAAAIGDLLALCGDREGLDALRRTLEADGPVGARLAAAKALVEAGAPGARAARAALGDECRAGVSAYAAWLSLVASDPDSDMAIDAVAEMERDGVFRPEHPSHSRYLWGALARNNAAIWTPRGLRWLEEAILRSAPVNENVALLLLSALQLRGDFREPLKSETGALLRRVADALPSVAPQATALAARVAALSGPRAARSATA